MSEQTKKTIQMLSQIVSIFVGIIGILAFIISTQAVVASDADQAAARALEMATERINAVKADTEKINSVVNRLEVKAMSTEVWCAAAEVRIKACEGHVAIDKGLTPP